MSRQVRLFLVLTFAFTWICWWCLAFLSGRGTVETGDLLYWVLLIAGGSSPTIFAYVAVARCREEKLSDLNRRVFKFKVAFPYYVFAIFVPVAVAFSGHLFFFLTRGNWMLDIPPNWIFMAVPVFISSVLMGGLEEVGWRGVMQEGMDSRWPLLQLNLFIGVVWALWHLPFFFIPGMSHFGTSFLPFLLGCIGYSGFLTWLYYLTRSAALTVIFHAMINASANLGFGIPLAEGMPYLFNAVLMIVISTVLLLVVVSRKKPAN